jgi:hypothetical protein
MDVDPSVVCRFPLQAPAAGQSASSQAASSQLAQQPASQDLQYDLLDLVRLYHQKSANSAGKQPMQFICATASSWLQ